MCRFRYTLILYSGLQGLGAVLPLRAQPLLTLAEVVQQVLAHNFDIQIVRNKQKIATKNHRMGLVGFLPSLDAGLGINAHHQTWPLPNTAAPTNLSAGLTLQWNIFSGMRRVLTYQHLGIVSQMSQLEARQQIEKKVAEVIIGYYQLALAQQKKHVLENSLSVSEEALKLASAQYELGQCSRLEYLNAQVQHHEVQAKLLSQEEETTAAKLVLRSLLGKVAPEDFSIIEDIPLPSELSWGVLTQAMSKANTSMHIAQKHYEDATLAVKLKRADLWPSFNFGLGYNLGSKRHDQCWEATPRGWQYSVSIRFNLFNAFRHVSAIQEAGIQADNAQLALRAKQQQLKYELQKYFLHYTQQLRRYELAQQHVQVSQENVAVALAQYRLGGITLLVLDKARQSAQETTLNGLQTLYDVKVAEVELQRLAGTLLDVMP